MEPEDPGRARPERDLNLYERTRRSLPGQFQEEYRRSSPAGRQIIPPLVPLRGRRAGSNRDPHLG